MSADDSRLKVIHDLICRVDEQRRQLRDTAEKIDQLQHEIAREIASGPLSPREHGDRERSR